MKSRRFIPKRYQLNKHATKVFMSGHPWIYRNQLSSAAAVFTDGQWLQLVDAHNAVLGFGIFQAEGLQGIRILKVGNTTPDLNWIGQQLKVAMQRREVLQKRTNAFRALNGESDYFPGIVFDVYGRVGVLQTYTSGVDVLGRYVGSLLRRELGLGCVLWKLPTRRTARDGGSREGRILFGAAPVNVTVEECGNQFAVSLGAGQKSGTFLDLRGLRQWLLAQEWRGKRLLNLFSYSGILGLCAAQAGAAEVINVDDSQAALDFGQQHHGHPQVQWQRLDIFARLKDFAPSQRFDVIICDPPLMAVNTAGVVTALKAYRGLFSEARTRLNAGGTIICCCCTSRVSRAQFVELCNSIFSKKLGFTLIEDLPPEIDHPVRFAEGDYLKILIYRRKS